MTDNQDIHWVDEDGRTQLYIAARDGREGTVAELLSIGADINQGRNNGMTPIFAAAGMGHEAIVALLLSHGADVNQAANDDTTPIYLASQEGHEDTVTFLHSHGANVNKANDDGCTPIYVAAWRGHENIVTLLLSYGANVNETNNHGATPIFAAAQQGHEGVVTSLLSHGADVNKANNNGITPIVQAIYKKNNEVVRLLRAFGASIPTEELDLDTVDDVVNFYKCLNVQPKKLPTMEENIRKKKINASKLFAIPDGKTMLASLGVSDMADGWGLLFYNLMKYHQKIQDDRKQSSGAAERAAKALNKMDNKTVRHTLYDLQCKLFTNYFKLVMPSLQNHSECVNNSKLMADDVKEELHEILEQIQSVAKDEESRLGSEVTELCLDKYKALEERWTKLESLPELSRDKKRNSQPIANTNFGVRSSNCKASPFGSTNGNSPDLERLEHFVLMSRFLAVFFERQMLLVTEKVNKAENPQELGLSYDEFVLPFNNSLAATGGKRANLTMGPIKKAGRALKKAKEYEQEMKDGKKPSEINGIQVLSPSDYVIDFLRCTIEVEDPYLVAVVFSVLLKEEVATCLQICRVKNKFVNKKLPKHKQTNVLMNLALLYPHNADEFKKSGLMGEFNTLISGKCMMVCELQITMKDFLMIKRLSQSYYDITRVKQADLPNFLFMNGVFINPNLEEKIPSIICEMTDKKKDTHVSC
mmetsp:Transcript_149/g.187  ORF Transcript_149/g.187 Transcript_149/m.187 type:complete len:702 (+) Transcript_149:221-2326(+)